MDDNKKLELQADDFQNALRDMDTYIDVSVEDLMRIGQLAQQHAKMRTAEQVRVENVMTTKVITVTPATSLQDAARILLDNRISGLPVVDDQGLLLGIVTEADFLCAMGIPCHHPAHNLWQTLESMFVHPPQLTNMPRTIADIMKKNVITVSETQSLHDAVELMKKHHIKRLIVASPDNQVRGILTRSNLVKILLQKIF